MVRTSQISLKNTTKKTLTLSKESVVALREITTKPIKVNSLSDFWADIRS